DAVFGKVDLGAAFGKAGHTPAALAVDRVAERRIEVRQRHLAAKGSSYRSDRGDNPAVELGVGHLLADLATGDALFEELGIVEPLRDVLARRGDAKLAGHLHRRHPFL